MHGRRTGTAKSSSAPVRIPRGGPSGSLGCNFLHPEVLHVTYRLIVAIDAIGHSQVLRLVLGRLRGGGEQMLGEKPMLVAVGGSLGLAGLCSWPGRFLSVLSVRFKLLGRDRTLLSIWAPPVR